MKETNRKLMYLSSNYLLPFSLFIGLGITKIVNMAGNDAWISVILGTILGLGINYIFVKLPKNNNKVCTYIVNFCLLLLGITTLTKLISSVYLDKTSNLIVCLPFIILIFYTSMKDNYSLFKTTSILNLIYLLFILFAFGSLIPSTEIDNFKPILINPLGNILLGSLEFALYSTVPLMVMPDLKEKYNYKAYLGSCLFLLIIFGLIIGNLGLDLAKSYRYPEYMLFKNINILDFIENIENVLFFVWIINIYTLTAHASLNIKSIVGIKGLILTLIINVLFINMFLINSYFGIEFLLDYFDLILLIIVLVFIFGKIIK